MDNNQKDTDFGYYKKLKTTRQVSVRFNLVQLEQLEADAKEVGLNKSQFLVAIWNKWRQAKQQHEQHEITTQSDTHRKYISNGQVTTGEPVDSIMTYAGDLDGKEVTNG